MLKSVLDVHETQSDALDLLFAFDAPKGAWRIQRPDGQYFHRWVTDVREFTPDPRLACPFQTERSAQHIIDIQQGSQAGRIAFAGCKPVCWLPLLEPGDHIVCSRCGTLHEASYCPTADGHGVAL